MFKRLNIPYYENGYHVEINNCRDILISAATGNFYYMNYFYYNSIWCVDRNYRKNTDYDGYEKCNILGLSIKDVPVENNLIEKIKLCIDNNSPVLFQSNNACLFFNDYEEVNDDYTCFLIDGYDEISNKIVIRHYRINSRAILQLRHVSLIGEYIFTNKMISDIYDQTQTACAIKYPDVLGKICCIEKEEEIVYLDKRVYEYYIECKRNQEDAFQSILENVDFRIKNEGTMVNYRSEFYHSFIPFKDSMYRLYTPILKDEKYRSEFEMCFQNFMLSRDKILMIINKYIINKKELPNDRREGLIQMHIDSENSLYKFLNKMNDMLIFKTPQKEAIKFF